MTQPCYSRQEALESLEKYFEGNKLRASTFLKYLLQDKHNNYYELTPNETVSRIAKELARIELKYKNPMSYEEILPYLEGFKRIVFQGSPMMGIGNNFLHISLSNCIVIEPPDDTMSSIINRARDMANLFKRRAGVGIDLSRLRPEGASVNNSAKTSTGAWSFAGLYSDVGRKIGQAGRRGAMVLTMDIRHPDALKFARSKTVEGEVRTANISLKVTDDFFEAVEKGETFKQQWPIDSDNPKVVQEIDAAELFDEIARLAAETGDPGLLLWDNITKWLPANVYPDFETICVNPCQPAWATVLTPQGISTIGDIKSGDTIWSGKQWTKVVNKWSTGTKEVYGYHTAGGSFYGTKNHKVLSDGNKIEVCKAKTIDAAAWPGVRFSNVSHKITDIEFLGKEEVFDITVDGPEHTYWTDMLLVSNCGELPLSSWNSCRLLSQTLTTYVVNPFTEETYFDFDKLYEDTVVAQRFADNLIDLELEKLENLINVADTEDEKEVMQRLYKSCEQGRETGVGTHGLADVFIMMGHTYGDEASIELTEAIYNTRANASYRSSALLAGERGSFPVYNKELERDHPFIQQLNKETLETILEYGRRNMSNLTNAPTGSLAIVVDTAPGIDPNFSIEDSFRKKRKNHDDPPTDSDYLDSLGDKWEVFGVTTPIVRAWTEAGNSSDNLPEYFIEANDVDIDGRLKVQAAAQRWIDHSISNTFNLPKGTSKEVVKDIYFKAWKYQVKGVTVFVDGCKEGILGKNDPSGFKHKAAIKRPETLPCDIHSVKIKQENWTIIVGLVNNKPYEVFGGLADAIEVPKSHTSQAKIQKVTYKTRPAAYNLTLDNGFVIKDIGRVFNNDLYQIHTRMVSLSLRHGAEPSFIAEQLQKDKSDSDLTSFSKVLARVLKKYVSDGTRVTSDKYCKECGADQLVYQDGCPTCMACGSSKCS